MSLTSFGRKNRLSGKSTFRRLFAQGATLRSHWLALTFLPNAGSHTRFGCTVRRQATKGGACRNRLKRWLREAFRRNQALLPSGIDLVAVVLKIPEGLTFQRLEEEFLGLSRRLALQPKSSFRESGSTEPLP